MSSSTRRLFVAYCVSTTVFGQTGCSFGPTSSASSTRPTTGSGATVSERIQSDPQFTTYAAIARDVGLGPMLRTLGDVTLFAPTNSAFDGTPWANLINPDLNSTGGASAFQRQRLVEASVVDGVHTPEELAGKRQNVRTMGGIVFELDGTHPGQMTLAVQRPEPPTGIGFAASSTPFTARLASPIQASNGIIYPVDKIIVGLGS